MFAWSSLMPRPYLFEEGEENPMRMTPSIIFQTPVPIEPSTTREKAQFVPQLALVSRFGCKPNCFKITKSPRHIRNQLFQWCLIQVYFQSRRSRFCQLSNRFLVRLRFGDHELGFEQRKTQPDHVCRMSSQAEDRAASS